MKSIIFASLIALALAATPAFERPFDPKTEYVYKFDGLILSGLPTSNSEASHTRISCRSRIQAVDDRYIHLQLSDIQFAASNVQTSEQWPELESLEKRELSETQLELLQLPVRAVLRNGLVSELQFSEEDAEWSKNTKRAILNLISLRKTMPLNEKDEFENEIYTEKNNQFFKTVEKTIEGDCEVAYTIVREEKKTVITKSVNFEKCTSRPELAYGLRFSSECKDCKEQQVLKPHTVYTYTFEEEKLQQAEVHSVYTVAVDGQEVIKSETRSKLTYEEDQKINREIKKVSGEKEEIIYSARWEETVEKFFKNGEKNDMTPFSNYPTEKKMEQLHNIIKNIQEVEENTPETVHLLARVVRIFRMCTIDELKIVHEKMYKKSEKKIQLIMENALAISGTKNTIEHLLRHIELNDITPIRAAELFKSIQETQYPSEHIANMLIKFAETSIVEKHEVLRQSVWLCIGSVVRGVVSKTQDIPLIREHNREVKEKFLRTFMNNFRKADSTYEKVLALKTLANAGIDLSVFEISEIIVDRRQPLSIRIEAIDALRLLKDIMPLKIQKVLLPIYKNRQLAPELRMAALYRIMHTIPEQTVLAQIVSQMELESNQHVAAFTFDLIHQFARTSNPCYMTLATRCSKVLMLTRYQPQEEFLSTYMQRLLFYKDLLAGIQFDLASIFEKNSFLPKELQVSLESVFGENWNKYFWQLGFSQQQFENVIYKLADKFQLLDKSNTRVTEGITMINKVMKSMNIRPRVHSNEKSYAHVYLRYKDMDYAVLPIEESFVDELINKYVSDSQIDMRILHSLFTRNHEMDVHRAAFFYEATRAIPTTIGVPVMVSAKIPTVFSIQGKVSFNIEKFGVRLVLDVVPSLAATHITQMRFWSPMFEQGVKTLQSIRSHTPLKFETLVEYKKGQTEFIYKISFPEGKKTLVALYSRPVAFLRYTPMERYEHVESEEMTIFHPQMQLKTQEIEYVKEILGLKMMVRGNALNQWSLRNVLMSEQNIEYVLENMKRPVEFVARINFGDLKLTNLDNIKFDHIFEKEFDLEESTSTVRRDYFHKMIRDSKVQKGVKHVITLKLEAPQDKYLNAELRTICQDTLFFCKWEIDVRRSPLPEESREWTLFTEILAARPMLTSTLRQLREQPHREVQLAINTNWGGNKKNQVMINGQIGQSKEQKMYLRSLEREMNGLPEYELLLKAARLNQINAVVEYKLTPETEYTFARFFDLIKAYNFWTLSERRENNEDRRIVLQLTVEPVYNQYMNMTLRTPETLVELKNTRIPRVTLPSIAQRSIRHQLSEMTGSTCKVDQSEVYTFDKMIYRTPLVNCYSVIAKDCSETPRFVVLAKKSNKNSEELTLRVLRNGEEIVVEKRDEEFLVKVDDKLVKRSSLLRYEIEILGDNLVVVSLPTGEVRFDGYTIKTNLPMWTANYKMCGLCGNHDGERDNELRTADNYETEDLEEFHRSFLLKDENCDIDESRLSEKKNYLKNFEREEKDVYDNEYESEYTEKKIGNELVKKTLVKEFSSRVCFSIEPVTECRRGFESDEVESKKVRFTCMPRHNKTARRFLRDARDEILRLEEYPVSYVEAIKLPTTCVEAY